MILRALGCSGSVLPGESHFSLLVGSSVLIDMGSAASALTLEEQCAVRDIILTHAHLDHTKDIGFFAENVFLRIEEPVRLRGTRETLDSVRRHLLNDSVWPNFTVLPTVADPTLVYTPFGPDEAMTLGDLTVHPTPNGHMPGSVGFLLTSPEGAVFVSGDTGPTEEIPLPLLRSRDRIRAVLMEVSFPCRLQDVATASRHLTPATLAAQIERMALPDVPVYLFHMKGSVRDETVREIEALGDDRLRILAPGTEIAF